jgi:serine/threonine-protein kinase RsbW
VLRALALARAFARRAALADPAADRLAIVVEEWIANVVEHGAPRPGSRIGLRLEHAAGTVRLTVSDAGLPFDPRTAGFEGPNLDRGGGVGLELVRAWVTIADYRRRAGRNRLVLEMRL